MPILENLFDFTNDNFLINYWRSIKLYPAVRASLWEHNSRPCPTEVDKSHENLEKDFEKHVTTKAENGKPIKCKSESNLHHASSEQSEPEKSSIYPFLSGILKDKSICPLHDDLEIEPMAPPYYADLGKKANDVFSKGYHFGVFKLDLKTKSESGVEFSSGIISNHESGKVFGSLQSKYAVKDYGLSFTEKWNTDNTLATDITIQDQIAAGLKITLEGTFAPQTGYKTGKLKTSYVNETVALNSNLDLNRAGPVVDVAGVLHFQGWLAGVHTQFDSQKSKFTKNNVAFGYLTKDFNLHTNIDNGKEFGGSIYQKVSEKIDCGVSMKWTSGTADTLFGVGAKVALDADASLHAKVNNKSLIGLGYQQKLRPGVVLTLSAAIDGQNFNAGGHKVGVALELEP